MQQHAATRSNTQQHTCYEYVCSASSCHPALQSLDVYILNHCELMERSKRTLLSFWFIRPNLTLIVEAL